ncbi:MAG TPA: ComEA family DNA-binding protein, partial [Ktedonosporobacter sp.]|nr:ComEA family DNA-binding protein [Ktedonosporobacter sp.]
DPPIVEEPDQLITDAPQKKTRKQQIARLVLAIMLLAAIAALYFIWGPALPGTAAPDTSTVDTAITQQSNSITQQSAGTAKTANISSASSTGTIQVYIVGAVKRPGVYTMPANARVYQLLQLAGGPLPGANLISLNLAAKLSDGQEIYITRVGEKAPTNLGSNNGPDSGSTTANTTSSSSTAGSSGTPVNINTASAAELRQSLHVSATTANAIINYRVQHGPYTSVDQLANVVSIAIYNRIKDLVTVE